MDSAKLNAFCFAEGHKVQFLPGASFGTDYTNFLRLSFSYYGKEDMVTGAQRLGNAIRAFAKTDGEASGAGEVPGLKRQKAVYVDWSLSCKHPRTFAHDECVPAMARARALGCLFLRKVEAPVTHAAWAAWMENIQTSDIKESSSLRARAEAPAQLAAEARRLKLA